MSGWLDVDACLTWVSALAALGAVLSTVELLHNRRLFRDDGLLAWSQVSGIYRESSVLRWLLEYDRFVGMLVARLAAGLLLLLALTPWLTLLPVVSVCVAVLFVARLLLNYRLFTPEGADNMDNLVWGSLFFAWMLPGSAVVREASLWFLALHACLAYSGTGVHRLKDPPWRQDGALSRVLEHSLVNARSFAGVAKSHPRIGELLISSVLLVEIAFPLVLVSGFPLCWMFIAWGLAFHLFNTFVLGLNNFVWPFVATYPAILFCVARIEAWWA